MHKNIRISLSANRKPKRQQISILCKYEKKRIANVMIENKKSTTDLSLRSSTPRVVKAVIRVTVSLVGHPRCSHKLGVHVHPRFQLTPFQGPVEPEREEIGDVSHGDSCRRIHCPRAARRSQFSLRRCLYCFFPVGKSKRNERYAPCSWVGDEM